MQLSYFDRATGSPNFSLRSRAAQAMWAYTFCPGGFQKLKLRFWKSFIYALWRYTPKTVFGLFSKCKKLTPLFFGESAELFEQRLKNFGKDMKNCLNAINISYKYALSLMLFHTKKVVIMLSMVFWIIVTTLYGQVWMIVHSYIPILCHFSMLSLTVGDICQNGHASLYWHMVKFYKGEFWTSGFYAINPYALWRFPPK